MVIFSLVVPVYLKRLMCSSSTLGRRWMRKCFVAVVLSLQCSHWNASSP